MAEVALYSPYIPSTRGGGEKYLLSIAEVASKKHKTVLLVPSHLVEETKLFLPQYGAVFGLDLKAVGVRASGIGSSRGPLRTAVESKRYSHLFAMTDGSIFPSFAGRSYFIVQVPWTRKLSLPEKLKLNTWDKVLVYSKFVKEVIASSWKPKHLGVLSPYVDLDEFVPGDKESIVLNVGRFFRHTQSNSKRQDVVLNAFKRLVDRQVLTGYTLVLAGNVDPNPDSLEYLEELKTAAYGYHVNILTDISYPQLKALYAKSRFYWHAAGYGIDPRENPENTEHFGMTTLEAMASGCIPLVVPYGGQSEVVGDKAYYWESDTELYEKMEKLVRERKAKLTSISGAMRERAKEYSKEKFTAGVEKLLA